MTKKKLLNEALEVKGISPDKNIVLYDANGTDAKEVEKYLREKAYENLFTYDVKEWTKDESLPIVNYKNYHKNSSRKCRKRRSRRKNT